MNEGTEALKSLFRPVHSLVTDVSYRYNSFTILCMIGLTVQLNLQIKTKSIYKNWAVMERGATYFLFYFTSFDYQWDQNMYFWSSIIVKIYIIIHIKSEREHKNNSQHLSNKATQWRPISIYSPRLASNKSHNNSTLKINDVILREF